MTEEEARTKWCPMARAAGDHFAFNRWTGGEATGAGSPALCIASACMAWRWNKGEPAPEPSELAVIMHGTPEQRAQVRAEVASRRGGYCGLAGAPQ